MEQARDHVVITQPAVKCIHDLLPRCKRVLFSLQYATTTSSFVWLWGVSIQTREVHAFLAETMH